MITTIVLLVSISSAILISLLIKAVRNHPYFSEAVKTYQSIQVPETPRSKGDVRRLRKYRALYRSARRRMLLLFVIHISVFSLVYTLMILVVSLIARSTQYVDIPVSVPFLSGLNTERGIYYTHIYIIALIGFAVPIYLVSRSIRLESRQPP
ncbi:hypothetical protein [Desulfurococcus amylolyticus]|uniref:hypothetical protein n=1 Tax=Desulfurococcus amylolyticus TaxID=94694 RepID=UPI0005B1F821|nr:hypothetical protein [Desulfurococcus amylolyticus]